MRPLGSRDRHERVTCAEVTCLHGALCRCTPCSGGVDTGDGRHVPCSEIHNLTLSVFPRMGMITHKDVKAKVGTRQENEMIWVNVGKEGVLEHGARAWNLVAEIVE